MLTIGLVLSSFKSQAQQSKSNGNAGDTVTYVLYNNELSFDAKRTLVFDDKHSADSLINVLAKSYNKNYRIIYQKEGRQAQVVDDKFLKTMDKTVIYRLTIAYNKPDAADNDGKPLYIIRSK